MDRISAALILGITVLMTTSGIIIYETWISDASETMGAETIIQDSQHDEELVFNDDTSIKNNSCRKLWIRARLVYDSSYDADGYEIVSGAIDDGMWRSGGENWYYYARPVDFAQVTEPLVDSLLYNGAEVSESGGRFSLQVEAVDEDWFVSKPSDGMEAFEFFEKTMAIPYKTYL